MKSNNPKSLREQTIKQRYLAKDANGKVKETTEEMFRRAAEEMASAEVGYEMGEGLTKIIANRYYDLMATGTFLPNSPTLMNAGRDNAMLSACFVLPIEDSINGIFTTVKNTALIQKAGGGTGFSFDQLRPTGDLVTSSGGKTSGPISFWKVLSETTNAIQQGAFRRGANMGMMSIYHPDILKFIDAKKDLSAFNNFNISVKLTNHFMDVLEKDPEALHVVINPRTKERFFIPRSINVNTYTIENLIPENHNSEDCYALYTVNDIWDMITKNAHKTGEPGVCFIDRINEDNPTPDIGEIEACNPCGEQPLLSYEACNLGSVNLSNIVLPDGSDIDRPALKEVIEVSVRFLDNVIDKNCYPIQEIEEISRSNRKIGLGVMGFADALVRLGIRYDSQEAIDFAEGLGSFFQENAHSASEKLAKTKGCFPNWKGSKWDTEHNRQMRNATVTTIAPTGSISIIAGCNGGIEPIFSLAYKRLALDDQEFIELHPIIEKLGNEQGWLSEDVRKKLVDGVPPKNISEIPSEVSHALVTAHEVSPECHVRIQAAFQKNVDNAVSKTVNLPADASVGDVDRIFRIAHQLGCKGVTVYRDGCRNNQIIRSSHDKSSETSDLIQPRSRSRKTKGETTKYNIGCGKLYVSVNQDEHGLCEVFANLGKAGGCPAQSEATCRIASAAIRCGVDPEVLIEQLKGIRCLSTISRRKIDKNIDVLSCPDAIARAIEETLGCKTAALESSSINKCPDCGCKLRRESGCNICDNCGYSKCG